ncbi:MAG: NDP-sugar synthase [Saprospiraceae bacterium]
MKPTLMILAAGMGSRYGGLKQVDAIGKNGEAIIEYSIYDAIRAGFGKVVFIIRKSIEEPFKEKFAGKFDDQIEIAYAYQEMDTPIEGIDKFPPREKPWGTAHAMLVAHDVINEPFAVINADDYYGIEAFEKMAKFLTDDCAADHYSMVGYVLNKTLSDNGTVNRGVAAMDDDHMLTDLNERLKIGVFDDVLSYLDDDGETRVPLSDNSLVSMNYFGFHPSIFSILREQFVEFVAEHQDQPRAEFFIPLVVNRLIKAGEVKMSVIPCDDKWYGVTYQEDKPVVQGAFKALHDAGKYPDKLWG